MITKLTTSKSKFITVFSDQTFYPSTFVYCRFSLRDSVSLVLLSLVSMWGARWWALRGKSLILFLQITFSALFSTATVEQHQRMLDIQLYMNIKSPNNVLIYTNTHIFFVYLCKWKKYLLDMIEFLPLIFGGRKVLG